jgi:flagellar protein FlhE
MKNYKKLNGTFVVAGILSAACLLSQAAIAGTYNSSINLPTLHAKGYVYVAHLPVSPGPKSGMLIKSVSWSWNVHGWPKGLQVQLCQGRTRCIDVSRQRSGTTNVYNRNQSTEPFFYELRLSGQGAGPVPVAGLKGGLTVTW